MWGGLRDRLGPVPVAVRVAARLVRGRQFTVWRDCHGRVLALLAAGRAPGQSSGPIPGPPNANGRRACWEIAPAGTNHDDLLLAARPAEAAYRRATFPARLDRLPAPQRGALPLPLPS